MCLILLEVGAALRVNHLSLDGWTGKAILSKKEAGGEERGVEEGRGSEKRGQDFFQQWESNQRLHTESRIYFETGFPYVVQAGLNLVTLLASATQNTWVTQACATVPSRRGVLSRP